MGIALKVFAIYMIFFSATLWWDRKRGRKKSRGPAIFVPIAAVVIIVVLSVVKVWIIYKILLLLLMVGVAGLTYWHFRSG